jgi:HD superfamily phosphodiesterase
MTRLENLRRHIDHILFQLDGDPCAEGFIHLYGVSVFAILLARKRGLDEELAGAAGMLHDLWSYTSGNAINHAAPGAELSRRILAEVGGFSKDDIETIYTAILYHSDKAAVHSPFDELLKDADVLHHHFYNPSWPSDPGDEDRYTRIMEELNMG